MPCGGIEFSVLQTKIYDYIMHWLKITVTAITTTTTNNNNNNNNNPPLTGLTVLSVSNYFNFPFNRSQCKHRHRSVHMTS